MRRLASGLLLGVLALACSNVRAPEEETREPARRALIVGIDAYSRAGPRAEGARGARRASIPDLRGAVRDAQTLAALLEIRFGFEPQDVRLLIDEEATREGILEAIREHLIEPSRPGDLAVFHFSGHGSRIASSTSASLHGLDQTLVPFDAGAGARDVWDKELRALLNELLDRQARVTALFDCCFSGSITRGQEGARTAPWDEREASEVYPEVPAADGPSPARRGALVFAASQDIQVARELEGEDGEIHGLFSGALHEVLASAPPGESARRVFLRAEARMRASGLVQDPGLEGVPPGENGRAPFGLAPSGVTGGLVLPAVGVVVGSGEVRLRGGSAVGLAPGCELSRVSEDGRGPLRLLVTEVSGLSNCLARIIEGEAGDLRPEEDLFEVERWVVPEGAHLRVWIPPAEADLLERLGLGGEDGRVELVEDPALAHYRLEGGADGEQRLYRWVRADGSPDLEGPRRFRPGSLPADTRWTRWRPAGTATDRSARSLRESAFELARLRAWLTLSAPPDNGRFPYRLGLFLEDRQDASAPLGLTARRGQILRFALVRDPEQLDPSGRHKTGEQRYVYLFVVDSSGASTLLFPSPDAPTAENLFPSLHADFGDLPTRIDLPVEAGEVKPPFGVDTFVLLTTKTPLPDPWSLQWSAVKRSADGAVLREEVEDPLAWLLQGLNGAARAAPRPVPASWSIDRVQVESTD